MQTLTNGKSHNERASFVLICWIVVCHRFDTSFRRSLFLRVCVLILFASGVLFVTHQAIIGRMRLMFCECVYVRASMLCVLSVFGCNDHRRTRLTIWRDQQPTIGPTKLHFIHKHIYASVERSEMRELLGFGHETWINNNFRTIEWPHIIIIIIIIIIIYELKSTDRINNWTNRTI